MAKVALGCVVQRKGIRRKPCSKHTVTSVEIHSTQDTAFFERNSQRQVKVIAGYLGDMVAPSNPASQFTIAHCHIFLNDNMYPNVMYPQNLINRIILYTALVLAPLSPDERRDVMNKMKEVFRKNKGKFLWISYQYRDNGNHRYLPILDFKETMELPLVLFKEDIDYGDFVEGLTRAAVNHFKRVCYQENPAYEKTIRDVLSKIKEDYNGSV